MSEEMRQKLNEAIQRLEEEGLTETAASLRLAAICFQTGNSISAVAKQKRTS